MQGMGIKETTIKRSVGGQFQRMGWDVWTCAFFVPESCFFLLFLPSVVSNKSVFSWSILCSYFLSHTVEGTLQGQKQKIGLGGEHQQDPVNKMISNHQTAPHYFERSFRSRFINLLKTSHMAFHCSVDEQLPKLQLHVSSFTPEVLSQVASSLPAQRKQLNSFRCGNQVNPWRTHCDVDKPGW
jgi:hypothetical protein